MKSPGPGKSCGAVSERIFVKLERPLVQAITRKPLFSTRSAPNVDYEEIDATTSGQARKASRRPR
jgi:hypothetical protein